MTDEVLSVPLSRMRLLGIAAGSAAFVALGVLILRASWDESGVTDLKGALAGIASVGFFGLVLVSVAWKLFDPRPGLTVGPEGITDNSSGISAGFIPWSDIKEIRTTKPVEGAPTFLTIVVRNPDEYVRRGWVVQRYMRGASARDFGSPVQILASSLKGDFGQVVAEVESRYREHRKLQPSSARSKRETEASQSSRG